MTIRERIFASRLLEKARRNPDYAREIGLEYKLLPNLQVPDTSKHYSCPAVKGNKRKSIKN